MIRWKKSDYIRLGKAVSDFNKEISKNERIVNELALPDKIKYNELRDSINTRQGLESYIKMLKRIKQPRGIYVRKVRKWRTSYSIHKK